MVHFYKKQKIVKFPDLLYQQNCFFTSHIETNKKVASSFVELKHNGDNKNYKTKSKTKRLLDTPFLNTEIYGTLKYKHNCIKDWYNFRNNFPNIPLHQCTDALVKKLVKFFCLANIKN